LNKKTNSARKLTKKPTLRETVASYALRKKSTLTDVRNIDFEPIVKNVTFGVSIEELMEKQRFYNPSAVVPAFIIYIEEFLNTHALKEEGVMRISSSQQDLEEQAELLNQGKTPTSKDIHVHCSLLKKIFERTSIFIFYCRRKKEISHLS